MKVAASEYYRYYRPSKCPLRIYLMEGGYTPSPPGPLDELVVTLGERHEKAHLSAFPEVADLSRLSFGERLIVTLREIEGQTSVIYQGAFSARVTGRSGEITISGQPDFLIFEGEGYRIRDCKLARRIDEKVHPDIIAQMNLYGYLFKIATGSDPLGLEVLTGRGELVEIDYPGDGPILEEIEELVEIKSSGEEPYTPVGWSKCTGCGFFDRCWEQAVKRRDLATVPGVTLNLASVLRKRGLVTYDDLLNGFTAEELSRVKVPHGNTLRRVGSSAEKIMVNAMAIAKGVEIPGEPVEVPRAGCYVMFDLEGLPPYLDELDRIYLWGVKVFGDGPPRFYPSLAGFGQEGDRDGWFGFLRRCGGIFDRYGAVPFVHWASYERTKVRAYLARYGDAGGAGERVLSNLFDLHAAVRRGISLPIPSYSLKVVEQHIGFTRSMTDYGGEWAMAKYIEAVETGDELLRQHIMDQIVKYNEEDLDATWAVMVWFMNRSGKDETHHPG